MRKLFNVEAVAIERRFVLTSYKGNRILIKLMKLLADDKIYRVVRKDDDNFIIFEIFTLSKESKQEAANSLKNEILSYVPDNFPQNYIFSIGKMRLGFTYSFCIGYSKDDTFTWVFHKIKEMRKKSKIPTKQIHY